MPTHDFEKQVQQKMEELEFVPSEAVWQEVAKQIKERRDRRRLLIWWLLFPLAAGGSFGIYMIKRPATDNHTATTATGISSIVPVTTPVVAGSPSQPGTRTEGTGKTIPGIAAAVPLPGFSNRTVSYNERTAAGSRHKTAALRQLPAGGGKGAGKRLSTYSEGVAEPVNPVELQATTPDPVQKRYFAIAVAGASADAALPKQLFSAALLKADSTAMMKTPAHHERKMEWVVTANAGGSGISSGFSLLKSSAAAYTNDIIGAYANPGSSISAPGTYKPSAINPGLAFNAGLSVRRWLGHDFSLEAGILYSYNSTSIYTGSKVDSAASVRQGAQTVQSYNRNTGATTGYINQYHFIELPLRVQQQLGRRSPFSLNAGLNIGRFIGSNALQYDALRNIYYKDNTLFNKTQVSFSGGMNIRFWQQKPVSLELGPRVQYGMTNLFNRRLYGNRHLVFAGLEMRLIFGKK